MKDVKSLFIRFLPWFLAFVFASGLGLYFRTYPLRNMEAPSAEKMAKVLVARIMAEQLKNALDAQKIPGLSNDDKAKMAREQVQRLIETDPLNYQLAVTKAEASIRQSMPRSSGRRYLLEADPYYYFYLTENISRTGKIAEKIKGAQYFHPLMHAPYGYWTAVAWHPYVGWQLYQIVKLFKPGVGLMEGLCYVPLILTLFAALAFLLAAAALQARVFPFLIGLLALLLSPIFIQRSGFGWYDTDPYNYIFPFSILACAFTGFRRPDRTKICAMVAGFLTGLYAMFWTGWAFMLLLIPGALFAAFFALRFGFGVPLRGLANEKKYFLFHILASVIFAICFLTPAGFFGSVLNGWEILKKFSLSEMDVWPNIFLTVGEARGISIKKLIYLSGNYLTFGLALFGLLQTGFDAWKGRVPAVLFRTLFLFFISVPLFLLPLKTERFGILFVIPLSIYAMFGAEALYKKTSAALNYFSLPVSWNWKNTAAAFLILVILLPLPLLSAHIVSVGVKPIMDDAWYDTMKTIEEKTPKDAIVDSWWPPGYFTLALAKRRVIVDGGTQHLQEAYWMARILVSEDEKESAGLLRVLNTSGNDALLYLKSFGMEISEAVRLITSIAPLTIQEAARKMPAGMPPQVKNHLLELTHGKPMPPSYVLVYNDLIEQNLAVTMIARWNFQKAREKKQNAAGGLPGFLKGRNADYVQDFLSLTDGVLKYTPEVGAVKKEGDMFFFPNGLRVNALTKDAYIEIAQKGLRGRPLSLFYTEAGRLQEKTFEGDRVDASALFYQTKDGSYHAVMADARLIRSLLFRLYYLNAEGLEHFKPFTANKDAYTGTDVKVFEVIPAPAAGIENSEKSR